jgi:hypothetical protein
MPFGTCFVTWNLTYKCTQLNSILWRSSQEGILENLLDFSRRFESLFKIHQRFKYWTCSRIFNSVSVRNLKLAQLRKLFKIFQASLMQNLGIFWSKIRQPFWLYKFQPCGACSSASLSERRRPDRADDIPTVATTAVLPPTVSPSCRLHSTASGDYNGSTPPWSTPIPFSSSSAASPLLRRSKHRRARHRWATVNNPLRPLSNCLDPTQASRHWVLPPQPLGPR